MGRFLTSPDLSRIGTAELAGALTGHVGTHPDPVTAVDFSFP